MITASNSGEPAREQQTATSFVYGAVIRMDAEARLLRHTQGTDDHGFFGCPT